MLTFHPILNERVIRIYISQVFTKWHWGVARNQYADTWMPLCEPFSELEYQAIDTLKLLLQNGDGCGILYDAIKGQLKDDKVQRCFDILSRPAQTIVDRELPNLGLWNDALRTPPAWLAAMCCDFDGFFGTSEPIGVGVHLLPSTRGWIGGNGSMYVDDGDTTLECSGVGVDGQQAVFLTLLHEACHSVYQKLVLEPLVEFLRESNSELAQLALRYSYTDICKEDVSIVDLLGEMLVHSLVPDGVLLERAGFTQSVDTHWEAYTREVDLPLYESWVLVGTAAMIPVTRAYLSDSRILDEEWVKKAIGVVKELLDWKGF